MKRVIRTLLMTAMVLAPMAVLQATTTATAPSAGAAGCSLTPTNGPKSKFLAQGTDIGHYRLTVPNGLSGDVPLLVDLHGGGGNAIAYEALTGWPQYAMAKKSFILAAPDSESYGAWTPTPGESLDSSFILALVDDLVSRYCIDPKRVYLSGHSNGGHMTDRMACDHADVFAAVAPYAGAPSSMFGACNPSRPIPYAFFHGDADTAAPLALQESNRDDWLARESCEATPTRVTDPYGYTDSWDCAGGSEIQWRLLTGQTHDWPTGAKGEDMRDRMWAFFNAHPLP